MNRPNIACLLGLILTVAACSSDNTAPVVGNTENSNNASTENSSENGSPGIQNDAGQAPILSIDNYANVAGFALNFFATQALPGPFPANPRPQDFTQPESTKTDPDTNLEIASFTCANGGTATRTDRASAEPIFNFTDCQVTDSVLNGQLSFQGGKYTYNREFIDYSANVNGGTAIHTVTSGKINNRSGNVCGILNRTRSIEQYTITQGEQVFELTDWNTAFKQIHPAPTLCDTDILEISGQYSIRSIETDNNSLLVTVTEEVTGAALNPTAGEITITASDASMVAINFTTGDDATVSITITNSSGENSFDEPLSNWIDRLLLP